MNTFKHHILIESLSNPYPFKWTAKPKRGDWSGEFWTKNKTKIHVRLERDVISNYPQIVFLPDNAIGTGNEFQLTDEKDAFRIFATVMKMSKDFLEERRPAFFGVTADKRGMDGRGKNRHRLYLRLAKKYAPTIGYRVLRVEEDPDDITIVLQKKVK